MGDLDTLIPETQKTLGAIIQKVVAVRAPRARKPASEAVEGRRQQTRVLLRCRRQAAARQDAAPPRRGVHWLWAAPSRAG